MIRTHTFLKYARLHLQEMEAAIQDDDRPRVESRCSDIALTLLKAVSATVGLPSPGPGDLDRSQAVNLLAKVTDTKTEAEDLADMLDSLSSSSSAGDGAVDRISLEKMLDTAGQAFSRIHDLLVVGPVG